MANEKIVVDVDFRPNTGPIADAISRAVLQGFAAAKEWPSVDGYNTAISNLAQRAGRSPSGLLDSVMNRLNDGFSDTPAEFAANAAAGYNYRPSTVQGAINSAVAASLRSAKKKPDWEYKLEAQEATNELRRVMRQNSAADLVNVLEGQGELFAQAASEAATPEAQRLLLSRAAGRYSSVAARTIMAAGGVAPDSAIAALNTSASLSALRSGIRTPEQQERESARIAESASNQYMGNFRYNAGLFGSIAEAEATKAAQEDAAWAARGKELSYSESRKAREMEMGFRAIEASAPTNAPYNSNDPYATAFGISNSIRSATEYVSSAGAYPFGSVGRRANIALARGALSGITPSSMGKTGMAKKDIESNTQAIVALTDKMTELERSASDGGGSDGFWSTILRPAAVAGLLKAAGRTIGSFIEGRAQWLSDPLTPYQTRRDVRQGWAQALGLGAIGAGAGIGTLVAGPVGGAVGAAIGAIPGLPTYVLGTLYKSEKQIGDHWQNEAVKMSRYYNLYGSGVDYNYAGAVQNTGYMSRESMLQLSQTADMLPGALAFGAVSEQQMMALSLMPNYYAALMEGRSTAEIAEAYRRDMAGLPREYRQYITSILPGASEDLRAFTSSDWYNYIYSRAGEYRGYDQAELGVVPGLESKKFEIAHLNMNKAYQTAMKEIPNLNEANYNSPDRVAALREEYGVGLYTPIPRIASATTSSLESEPGLWVGGRNNPMLNAINSMWTGDKAHSKLGDIIIQIDGNTIHQQAFTYEDFLTGSQTFVVGTQGA